MKRLSEERGGSQAAGSMLLLSVVLLVLLVLAPASGYASTLRSIQASSPSSDKTILSLRFDNSDLIRLTTARGRIITLQGGYLPAEGINVRPRGMFAAIRPSDAGIEIIGSRYMAARLTSAGAGAYLLFLEPAVEPKPATPPPSKPVEPNTIPSDNPSNTSQDESFKPEARSLPEEKLVTAGQDTRSGYSGVLDSGAPATDQRLQTSVPSILPDVVRIGAQIAEQGDVDRALTYLASIQPVESGYGWSRVVMGELVEQQGDLSRALDLYREALVDPTTESVASVRLALAFQAQGNPEAASGMWERVIELSGGNLYIPIESPASRPLEIQAATAQPAAAEKEDERSGRPLWLTIVLVIVGLALLGGIGFGAYTLFKLIKKRKGEMPDELDLEDDLLGGLDSEDSVLDMPAPPKPKSKGAAAKAAKAYAETTQSSSPEPLTFGPGDEIDPEALAALAPSDDDAGGGELSDAKRKKLEAMYRQGSTVREIAETLGVGQDEVRMAINLAEAAGG